MKTATYCLCCCLLLSLVACVSQTATSRSGATQKNESALTCIAVLPVEPATVDATTLGIRNSQDLKSGAQFTTTVLAAELSDHDKVKMVSVQPLDNSITSSERFNYMSRIAKETGCDGILATTLYDYKQRDGGEYGANVPASAAFEMRLIEVNQGRSLWYAEFAETQQPLMSNLLSFNKARKRGFKWITVEELVKQGVADKLDQCPYL